MRIKVTVDDGNAERLEIQLCAPWFPAVFAMQGDQGTNKLRAFLRTGVFGMHSRGVDYLVAGLANAEPVPALGVYSIPLRKPAHRFVGAVPATIIDFCAEHRGYRNQ
jgi:hypothetical protein